MTAFRVVGGTCGRGSGAYGLGVFTMPDGRSRGVETVSGLAVQAEPPGAPVWTGQIVKGLQGALTVKDGLPRPLGLAASAIGAGLSFFDRSSRFTVAFADGATAAIEAEAALPAWIEGDRAVAHGVLARTTPPVVPAPADLEVPDRTGPAAIFEYEKRNGRLRRVVAKPPPKP